MMASLRQRSTYSLDADKRQLPDSLEQENFNLKLRIYHLEERLNQQYSGDISELVRLNAELNAQLDMKNESVQQRDLLLVKARNVIETLQNDIELLRASNGIKSDNERTTSQEEIRRSNATINQLSLKLQESEQKLKSTEAELTAMKESSQQLTKKLSEFEITRDKAIQYERAVSENNYLKATTEKLEQQLAESQKSCFALKENLSDCLLKLQNSYEVKTQLQNELAEVRSDLNKAADRNSNVFDRLRIADVEAKEKHSALMELEKKCNESLSKISQLENDLNAASKREAALLDELQKWKSVSQSHHEDKQNLEQRHQQSLENVQRSAQLYCDTLSQLSSAIERIVQCLHHLHVPSIPLHPSHDHERAIPFNDDSPPKFDARNPEQAHLTVLWIERKFQRIARIRSSLKITVAQVEEHWTVQFNRLEQMIKHQDKAIEDVKYTLRNVRQSCTDKKEWNVAEGKLHMIARELDASSNHLRSTF